MPSEPMLPGDAPRSDGPLWGQESPTPRASGTETAEPPPPYLEVAKERVHASLPRDPYSGLHFDKMATATRPHDFEFLGLGVYSYVAHLHRMCGFFALLTLLSVPCAAPSLQSPASPHESPLRSWRFGHPSYYAPSSRRRCLLANGYGGRLAEKQVNVLTWLFTGTSLGNAVDVSPAYGATEFLISTLMSGFLFWSVRMLDEDALRVEQRKVTPADFTVMISGLPTDLAAAPIHKAFRTADGIVGKHISDGIVVALQQRDIILVQRELADNVSLVQAYTDDINALVDARAANGSLSEDGAARLAKLEVALASAQLANAALMNRARVAIGALNGAQPRCAGVAFVTFQDANDAINLLEQETLTLLSLGPEPFKLSRPMEPSDIIWENLGCTDGASRQLRGTAYVALLSLGGASLIGASSYLQPHVAEDAASLTGQLGVMVIGTAVLLGSYLVVLAAIPLMEVKYMRHTTTTQKEVSQVLKLVLFQVWMHLCMRACACAWPRRRCHRSSSWSCCRCMDTHGGTRIPCASARVWACRDARACAWA